MKAIVKNRPGRGVSVMDYPDPAKGKDPIIKILAAAICGTDVHVYEGSDAYSGMKDPVVIGHEACGVVEDPGESGLSKGQKVVLDSVWYCGTCFWCKMGKENLCANRKTVGLHIDGAFAEYVSIPQRCVIPVSQQADPTVFSCAEPFGIAMHAMERADCNLGDSAVIIGPGPIGLMSVILCRRAGLSPVAVIGTRQDKKRLALAEQLGAEMIFYAEDDTYQEAILRATGGLGPSHIFEWSGSQAGFSSAAKLIMPGGELLVGAIYGKEISMNLTSLVRREITVKTVRSRVYHTWQRAIALLEKNEVDLTPIVSHIFPIAKAEEAFELASNKEGIKIVFSFT